MHGFLNRLVPFSPGEDDAYHRGYILVAACFLTGLFSVGYALLDAVVGYWVGTVVMGIVAVLFFVLPPVFRHTGSVGLIANLFLLVGTGTVLLNVHFSGGSEILPWLAVVPIAGVLLTGRRAGALWTALAMVLATLYVVLEAKGIHNPAGATMESNPVWVGLIRVGLPLIVYLLARVFQDERVRALGMLQARHAALELAMRDLKEAQTQLVRHEKLVSLGQVAAGIAHEIKNPLNFVTNFSSLTIELAGELRHALRTGDHLAAGELIDEVEANAGRIHAHGERADAIVRSMLAHARTERGAREPTDLNAIVAAQVAAVACKRSLRPLDARVTIETRYAPDAGTVDVAPEEIERALHNLLDNAVYAARSSPPEPGEAPRVRVETAREGSLSVVRIRDNGPGIPADLHDRVFEPFFTTKPRGEGIGLGLSLSYEIVHARHGGTLSVEAGGARGATFVMALPTASGALPTASGVAPAPPEGTCPEADPPEAKRPSALGVRALLAS